MALCIINNSFSDDFPISGRLLDFIFFYECVFLYLHFPKILLHTELISSRNAVFTERGCRALSESTGSRAHPPGLFCRFSFVAGRPGASFNIASIREMGRRAVPASPGPWRDLMSSYKEGGMESVPRTNKHHRSGVISERR